MGTRIVAKLYRDPRIWIPILVCLGAVAVWIAYANTHPAVEKPKASCTSPGLLVPATLTLKSYIAQSSVIASGEVVPVNDNSVQIKIAKTLEGNALHSGQTITLCSPQVNHKELGAGATVLLFLKGKDDTLNSWVLVQPYGGVFVRKDDNKYHVGSSKDTYSLDEIQQTIREHK